MSGLPFDHAIRNLGRRPLRTCLTALASALVAALLVATSSFVRGLERGFVDAADGDTAIVMSAASERDVVRSSISVQVPDLIAAGVSGIRQAQGVAVISPEMHLATNLRLGKEAPLGEEDTHYPAFLRGITPRAFLVHDVVTIMDGRPPRSGEVLVGRLVPERMGVARDHFSVGSFVRFEGATYTVSGVFAAPGTTLESEIWTPANELRGQTRRDDLNAIFVKMDSPDALDNLQLFARRRIDLELVVIPSSTYYRELSEYFDPIRRMAWAFASLVALAAIAGGANTLNAAVQDRIRELATLLAIGHSGLALAGSLAIEAIVIAAAGSLAGIALAKVLLSGGVVRIAMGAFELQIDAPSVLIGIGGTLLVAVLGSIPAGWRVMRLPVAYALKET